MNPSKKAELNELEAKISNLEAFLSKEADKGLSIYRFFFQDLMVVFDAARDLLCNAATTEAEDVVIVKDADMESLWVACKRVQQKLDQCGSPATFEKINNSDQCMPSKKLQGERLH